MNGCRRVEYGGVGGWRMNGCRRVAYNGVWACSIRWQVRPLRTHRHTFKSDCLWAYV